MSTAVHDDSPARLFVFHSDPASCATSKSNKTDSGGAVEETPISPRISGETYQNRQKKKVLLQLPVVYSSRDTVVHATNPSRKILL
jgi:hypothetical protein